MASYYGQQPGGYAGQQGGNTSNPGGSGSQYPYGSNGGSYGQQQQPGHGFQQQQPQPGQGFHQPHNSNIINNPNTKRIQLMEVPMALSGSSQ
jgi:hypothetical protein